MTAPREALLLRCVEALQADGFSHLSLREIATATGTSHRMLLYHFGSRDGLLAAIVGEIEARQRAALAELTEWSDILTATRSFWARLADPALAPAERLFFEVYSQAIYGREWTATFRESVIDAWEGPLIEFVRRAGYDEDTARAAARLGLAVTRGLLLDLLMTGDRTAVDRALELYLTLLSSAGPSRPPEPSSSA